MVVSNDADVPCVAGVLRGVLVLPTWATVELEDQALELVLRHELIHVARGDLQRGLLTSLLRIPFTGHPMVNWILRELVLAREEGVDQRVAAGRVEAYAKLLLQFAKRKVHRPAHEVGMGAGVLRRRIDALFPQRVARRVSTVPLFGLAVLLCGVTLTLPRGVLAEEAKATFNTIIVAEGSVRTLHLPGARAVEQSKADIAKVEASKDGGSVQVTALRPGIAVAEVQYKDGHRQSLRVHVVSDAPPPDHVIHLSPGRQVNFPIQHLKTLSIADPSIADVKVLHDLVLITGVSMGETILLAWDTSGHRSSYSVKVEPGASN
jgi:hypothetical protein